LTRPIGGIATWRGDGRATFYLADTSGTVGATVCGDVKRRASAIHERHPIVRGLRETALQEPRNVDCGDF